MKDSEASSWKSVSTNLGLFRFQDPLVSATEHDGNPILLLHGTLGSHLGWQTLAHNLTAQGAPHIYALDLPEIRDNLNLPNTYKRLKATIDLIGQHHVNDGGVVLIGFGAGGLMAYRYWQQLVDSSTIAMIFMLATPHQSSIFQGLNEASISTRRPEEEKVQQTSMLDFNRISLMRTQGSTALINVIGNAVGPDFDGVVRGMHLPETINYVAPCRHADIKDNANVAQFIYECLCGNYYQVQLKLVGMQMRRPDFADVAGPIAFEIEGVITPPDTVFQPVVDRMYLFEETVPPLSTLAFPCQQASATVGLHLRDLSNTSGRRRRMYTRLHIPLVENGNTAHTMQDSEGSDFIWRIVVKRLPAMLGKDQRASSAEQISRGI